MAALTSLLIFSSLLVSTTFAIRDLTIHLPSEYEQRPAFEALPLQFAAERKEFYFHVYYHETLEGSGKTTQVVVNPNGDNFPNFAELMIMDVPLWDSLNQTKLIGRAQGSYLQADQRTLGWLMNFNIVFELEALKGSTLQVMGRALEMTTPREWSVIGGTGALTMAQGIAYGRRLSSPDDTLWIELKIYGYYTPMQMPAWNPPPPPNPPRAPPTV